MLLFLLRKVAPKNATEAKKSEKKMQPFMGTSSDRKMANEEEKIIIERISVFGKITEFGSRLHQRKAL